MATATLKNGGQVDEATVPVLFVSLRSLADEGLQGMRAIFDLVGLCEGRIDKTTCSSESLRRLSDLALVTICNDGSVAVSRSVRDIVLSGVVLEPETLGIRFVSPFATPKAT